MTVQASGISLAALRSVSFLEFCVRRKGSAVAVMRPDGAMGSLSRPEDGRIVEVGRPQIVKRPSRRAFVSMVHLTLDTSLSPSQLQDLRVIQFATGRAHVLGTMWREPMQKLVGKDCVGWIKHVMASPC